MPAQWIHDGIGCLDSVQICSDLRTDPNRELLPGNRFVTIWHTDARSDLPPDADFSRKVDLDVVRIWFHINRLHPNDSEGNEGLRWIRRGVNPKGDLDLDHSHKDFAICSESKGCSHEILW